MNKRYWTNITSGKRIKCLLILFAYAIFDISIAFSNDDNGDSNSALAASLREKAKQCEKTGDIYCAIDNYRQYLLIEYKDVKTTYKLANMYFDTRNYAMANNYYDTVINIKGKKYPLVYFRKGIVCMNLEKYDDAIESLTKFRQSYRHHKDPENLRKLASVYIDNSYWAKNQTINGAEFEVQHINGSLNHPDIDFAPFPVDSTTLIYGAVYNNISIGIGAVRQIYVATKESGQWKTNGLFDEGVNNPGFNTGNAVMSADGKRMYFTRSRKNWKEEDICEIYLSEFDGIRWSEPYKLPYPVNDENYTSTQPAIGRNLRTGKEILYFVSNRPNGKGGLDIWYTEYDSKTETYKDPKDLSRSVNSLGDECSPFYDEVTTTLYFSSKGREQSYGGYDIYKAVGSGNSWEDATALPKPINSQFDEYYFSIFKNNKEGFFTSNRPGALTLGNGSCCDDIFSFKANECVLISSYGIVRNSTNYDIYDNLNRKYHLELSYPKDSAVLSDVPVELYLLNEKENEEILISKTQTDNVGRYHFDLERNKQYIIRVRNYGYFEKKVNVITTGVNCSDILNIGTTQINFLPKLNFRINIYYDLDKFKLSDQAREQIDTTLLPLFDLFPNAIIEIGSHTDSIGTDTYNLKLSQKRSESVVTYLISKGISGERLIAKGYGMKYPIAPNTNNDGSDNPEGRQLNRRTEIKIVGEISSIELNE